MTGKVSDGTRLQIDTDLDLRVNPVQVASGARQRNDGHPTSWMVVTNDESTVDIASMDGWGETGAVRFESNVDARIRVLLPAAGEIPSL
ncbi:MAG: hypothetical protein CME26_15920 [Gemmatimonadetes bacterium]|nr:hypothetical protein [Gemmatimonadota bacterium]